MYCPLQFIKPNARIKKLDSNTPLQMNYREAEITQESCN
jgi:hypothetical protein